MNLSKQVIIVTGATSGIGLAISKQALKLGAKVMLHCSPNSLKTAKNLVKQLGENAAYVVADLSQLSELSSIISATIAKFGTVTGLVNNAAISPRNTIFDINANSYELIMAVNFRAPLFLCQAVIEHFTTNKINGTIVNIGSINAYCGQNNLLVYSASKGALMTMTRNLANSLGNHNIRVNQINVGWTHTEKEHQTQINAGKPENWHQHIDPAFAPRGTILSTKEVANHVAFWLSDASTPVSGCVYEVEQYPVIGRNKISRN